jgi:hypothetical protein
MRPGLLFAGLAATVLSLAASAYASAPALTQAAAPPRTVYIAKDVRSLVQTPFVRTRDCVRRPRSCINGRGGLELVYLTKGKLPATRTTAKVLTDTDCAADHYGISHCSNILRLASGRTITVRHDHSMMNDPCLSPGERVSVRLLR